ncbi:MAG: hypothetical protein MI861_12915, partial [Pirellulales bacterium]|nr:hypothetical protein [Pirellulales bacterium]
MSRIVNRISHHRNHHVHLNQVAVLAAVLGLLTLTGCGKTETISETVAPPSPTGNSENEPSSTEQASPPGGMVLPPGEIPPPEEGAQPKTGGIEMPAGANVPTDDSAANPSSPVEYGTWEEIQQQVTSSGRITVVDLWSLTCDPCLKEFPGLVRLHQKHGDTVHCVAVDVDFNGIKKRPPEYYEERVRAFVNSVGAEFTTYISRTPSDDIYAL